MVEHGSAASILNEWRAVERELEDPELGPMAREILEAKADNLRDRYQALLAAEASPQDESRIA